MRTLGVTILCVMFAGVAEGRFFPEDADQVDDEERLSTEYYNDEISYRPPIATERLWRQARFGLFLNAGSYNDKTFMYHEDIKASSPDDNPVTLSFEQYKRVTLLGEEPNREIRLRLNHMAPFYAAVLADGASDKAVGDIGAAIGILPRPDRQLDIYAWKVDHFYNSKTRYDGTDERDKEAYTYGVRYDWAFASYFRTVFVWEIDTPIEWTRASRSYNYTYEQARQQLQIEFGEWDSGMMFRLLAEASQKDESKEWTDSDQAVLRSKAMERSAEVFEAMINYAVPGADFTTGAVWIERDADYTWSNTGNDDDLLETDEDPTPDIERAEIGYYATHYQSMGQTFAFQYGLHANFVNIDETDETQSPSVTTNESENELKLQTAWHFIFNENANIFLNLSWDMDDIIGNFPYTDEPFKPWGGGNIQVQLVL